MHCIVLSTLKYKDDSLIVETYSQSEGRLSLLVKISHNPQAAVRYTLFQPLALLDVQLPEKRGHGALVKPVAAHALQQEGGVNGGISYEIEMPRSTIALFLAEFLRSALRNEPPSEALYAFLETSVQYLYIITDVRALANFHLSFLLQLARYLGLEPTPEEVQSLVSLPHDGSDALLNYEQLFRMRYHNMHLYALTRLQRQQLLHGIIQYYEHHIPQFAKLRSLDVLMTLFD